MSHLPFDSSSAPEHRVGQEQRELREDQQQGDEQPHRVPERPDAAKDRVHRHVRHDPLHDEDVDADRRTEQPHLYDQDRYHSEPHQVDTERLEHRQDDRQREDQHGEILHEGPQRQIGQDNYDQDAGGPEIEAQQEAHHDLGQLGQRHERDEDVGAHQDQEHGGGGPHSLQDDRLHHRNAELPAEERDQQREARPEPRRLDRREQAEIDAADGDEHDQHDAGGAAERGNALRHRRARTRRPGLAADRGHDEYRGDEQQRENDAGQDAGQEQPSD